MSYANLELRKKTAREYYSKNPQVAKNNQEKKRQRNRDIIHEHCGYECCKCGSKKNLEYDHINPGLKKSRQSFLSIGKQDLISQLDNIQVLCKVCHTKRSQSQRKAAYHLFYSMPIDEQEKWINRFISHSGFVDRTLSFQDDEDTDGL
jgi:5-methylcytosine-specific restriction endonuclease McrA